MPKLNKKKPTIATPTKVVDHEQADKASTGPTPVAPAPSTPEPEPSTSESGATTEDATSTVAVDTTTETTLPDSTSVPEGAGSSGGDDACGGASGDSPDASPETGEQEGEQVLDTEPDNLGTTIYYFPNHDMDTPFSMFPPKDLGDCEVFTSVHQIKCNIKDKGLEARMVDAFEQTLASRMELKQKGCNYDY